MIEAPHYKLTYSLNNCWRWAYAREKKETISSLKEKITFLEFLVDRLKCHDYSPKKCLMTALKIYPNAPRCVPGDEESFFHSSPSYYVSMEKFRDLIDKLKSIDELHNLPCKAVVAAR